MFSRGGGGGGGGGGIQYLEEAIEPFNVPDSKASPLERLKDNVPGCAAI